MQTCGILSSTSGANVLWMISVDQLLSSCGLVLLNPSNIGTHSAGGVLDLVMTCSSCSGSIRVHDGVGCCNHAPGCPLLGSDHCLCAAATTLRRPPRCLPPLRDWHPVLLRAHNDLIGEAQEVNTCLCGNIPSNEHHRVRVIDFLYRRMVSILSWHVPHQQRSRHRCQPSWWTLECLAQCGGTFADRVPLRPIPVSGLPGWLSIELCAGSNARLGPIGRNVLRPFPVPVLVSLLQ